MDITTLSGFINTFTLPIIMSLIGAFIGHFANNGVIQFPIFVILYKKGNFLKDCKWYYKPIRWFYLCFHFLIFILGLRFNDDSTDNYVYIEMGFWGDLLIGIGTGILAKTTLSLADVNNNFTVISASLLAGFAGLSYIKDKAKKELDTEQRNPSNVSVENSYNDITETKDTTDQINM